MPQRNHFMHLTGPVIVASNLEASSDEALRQGHRLAQAHRARFVVCHVVPDLAQVRVLFPQFAGTDPSVAATVEERAREAVHDRTRTATGVDLAAADIVIETGSPERGIQAAAARVNAGVVVVGAGAVAARVAHQAAWAVLAARTSPAGGDVLAATDFSDPALPAVMTAAAVAAREGLPLRILHVVDLDPSAYVAAPGATVILPPTIDVTDALADAARAQLDAATRRVGTPATALVTLGPAAARILEAATQPPASLVVVGTHGRRGLPRWLLGSVAERVLRDAPCSVLVVPLDAGAAEASPA
jgi:nucleotide-binding universal stress UspA family protein